MGHWERKPGRQPNANCGKLGSHMSVLRDLVLSDRGLFGGFLSSVLRLQGHCLVQTIQTLLHKIPTGIPTGLVPITQEDQCNVI